MKKIIIVSDIQGFNSTDFKTWVNSYVNNFNSKFQIDLHYATVLASIPVCPFSQTDGEDIHRQFIDGGIDRAADSLILPESQHSIGIGFSIGGTILWKAALKGLKLTSLICISSTRLRYESQKPTCPIKLVFGQNDSFKPNDTWFTSMNLKPDIIPGEQHSFYSISHNISRVSADIKEFLNI